jgi:hypothetical protein
MSHLKISPTPNPNSLKIATDRVPFIESGMESFGAAEEAADHPLGSRLFALSGVANVFILPQFLTVTKQPAADWNVLLPQLESTLESYLDEITDG